MNRSRRRRGFLLLAPLVFLPLLLWSLCDERAQSGAEAPRADARARDVGGVSGRPASGRAAAAAAVTPATVTSAARSDGQGGGDSLSAPDAAGYVRTKDEQERLDAHTGSIRGRILDPDGRPVAGAFAQVRAGCGTVAAQTNARGEFLIPNVNVTWHEVVAVPPFGSDLLRGMTPTRVPAPRSQSIVEVRLRRSVVLTIHVDRPVFGSVDIQQRGGDFSSTAFFGGLFAEDPDQDVPQTTTEARVLPATYDLILWDSEQRQFATATVVVPPEGAAVELKVQSAGSLSGRVRDPAGRPVQSSIYVFPTTGLPRSWLPEWDLPDDAPDAMPDDAHCLTDAAGEFTIDALPAESFRIVVVPLDASHSRAEKGFTIRPGEGATVELMVQPAREVRVSVGRSLEDAQLFVYGPAGLDLVIDGQAAVRVRGLRPTDRAVVLAESSMFLSYEEGWVGWVEVSGSRDAAHLSVGPPAWIRVRAQDPGSLRPGAGLRFRLVSGLFERGGWRARLEGSTPDDDEPPTSWRGFGKDHHFHPLQHRVETSESSLTEWTAVPPGRWTVRGPSGTQTLTLASRERRTVALTTR